MKSDETTGAELSIHRRLSFQRAAATAILIGAAGLMFGTLVGCGGSKQPKAAAPVQRYDVLPPRDVPAWLAGSIFEQVDSLNTDPQIVSNYGVVVNLDGTGDARNVPNGVREYILNELARRSIGSATLEGYQGLTPNRMLADPRVAIVRVDAVLPPGARKEQRVDVQVSALDNNETTSLSGGVLYLCDLSLGGANPSSPGNSVDVRARARGPIFVNPVYALDPNLEDSQQRLSLRQGIIPGGGSVNVDRPLALRIRSAELRLSRAVEKRLDLQFADSEVAAAQDEGVVLIRVPRSYGDDWQRFLGVALHTYFIRDDRFAAMKAQQLAEEAKKPEAPLLNISYAWEALGRAALPIIQPLYTDASPGVAFAATRAGAFLGDRSAEQVLARMALDRDFTFRVDAVEVLGRLADAPEVRMSLRQVMSEPDTGVRLAAYRALVRAQDPSIVTRRIGDRFFVDVIENDGPPMIYATRLGNPRIAFIGRRTSLKPAAIFTAFGSRFSISGMTASAGSRSTTAARTQNAVNIFFRGPTSPEGVTLLSQPDLAVLASRLGGDGPPGEPSLPFTYGQVVAILMGLADQRQLMTRNPAEVPAFVLQEAPGFESIIRDAPLIPTGPRPVTSSRE